MRSVARCAALAFLLLPLLLAHLGCSDASRRSSPPARSSSADRSGSSPTSGRVADDLPDASGVASTTQPRAGQQPIAPDGDLWASPTAGPPVELDWLPPETQLALIWRPSAMLELEEGRRVLRALGPTVNDWLTQVATQWGIELPEVEQWTVALSAASSGPPHVTHVLRWAVPHDPPEEAARADDPGAGSPLTADTSRTAIAHQAVITTPDQRIWIVGSRGQLDEIAQLEGQPPLLRRQLEQLRRASDREQHVVLLFAPHFLLADGLALLRGSLAPLEPTIEQLFGENTSAGLLSVHLDPFFYAELRLVGSPERDAFHLADDLAEQLARAPGRVRSFVSQRIDPYWTELALALPAMMAFVQQQARVRVEGDQAVVNVALPSAAAHNLVLAAELALATPASAVASGPDESPADATPTVPASSGDEFLATIVDLEFPQHSLEAALDELMLLARQQLTDAAIALPLSILGEDLRQAGITRNQQIRDFQMRGASVQDVLTQLVVRANPTATPGANSPEQKLVWLVAPHPDGSVDAAILITTRDAAARRGWQLPAPFRAEGR